MRHEAGPLTLTGPRGVGLGLRWEFLEELLERCPSEIDFLEISPENYMRRGGYYPAALRHAASRYPVLTHGLTLSVGGSDPFDPAFLRELAAFVRDVGSPWHSDHLCFSSAGGKVLHDLLPIAFKERDIPRIADRLRRVEDALGVPFAIENISSYVRPGKQDMGEAEFISRIVETSGCGLLLDVNNAYVNAANFGFDAQRFLLSLPLARVVQIHVAGHEWFDEATLQPAERAGAPGTLILDTHGARSPAPVLELLEEVLVRTGPVPVVLERDQHIPPLDELLAELGEIRSAALRAASRRGPEQDATGREIAKELGGLA